jgi:hypothetical protein
MKGFNEIRGQMFRTSYDATTGEFISVPVAHIFLVNASVPETQSPPEYFWPRAVEQQKPAPAPSRKRSRRSA